MTRDAGAPPTWPVSGSGDNATAVGLYSAIVTALYRRERTGKGSYVTTSLLAEGVWSASVSIQAALAGAKFPPMHDRAHPASAAMNVYRAADGTWFVLIITPDKFAAVATAIGRPDLLTDPRFSEPAQLVANMSQLTAIFDEVFGAQAMPHWHSVFAGVNVTFGEVRGPQEVINDPQLTANEIVVPLEGAGGKVTSTISSPIQVHGVAKVLARRAPGLGEHTEEILGELGFDASSIESLREDGIIPAARQTRGGVDAAPAKEQSMSDIITERSNGLLEVNHALGFKADLRNLSLAAEILRDSRIPRARLLAEDSA